MIAVFLYLFLACSLGANAAEHFVFRESGERGYEVEMPVSVPFRASIASPEWLPGRPSGGSSNTVQFGSRLVLQIPGAQLTNVLADAPALRVVRKVAPDVFILEAGNAETCLREAARLSRLPGVETSVPVMRRSLKKRNVYAQAPNDPFFIQQWNLENRAADGSPLGCDLNVRAAWRYTHGEGILVAVADDGIDLNHPELQDNAFRQPHFNFFSGQASGFPYDGQASHGTAVAGLLAATANNRIGLSGVAPAANLASWVVLGAPFDLSTEGLMDMYQYQSNIVAVQNHSWGYLDAKQNPLSFLETIGISNAVHQGRAGLGVVMVRACGNEKGDGQNVNDEAEANIPEFIAVAAVRNDGRAAIYSERGACVLLAAPGGAAGEVGSFSNVITTDRLGALGFNTDTSPAKLPDYTFDGSFSGTSAAAPQISGIVALVLSANPKLSVRDVQQILILSARHFDLADSDLSTNGAGFRVSHNIGFGVPDAGEAVRLARSWTPRPSLATVAKTSVEQKAIPEIPLLEISAARVSVALSHPSALASLGPEVKGSSDFLPLEDFGLAQSNVVKNLAGKIAFIQRGGNYFQDKIARAAAMGASLALIYNNQDATTLLVMSGTDFTPIPALFIGQTDGDQLSSLQNLGTQLQARFNYSPDDRAAIYSFSVDETLLCEHVGVHVVSNHPRRSDLRIVLESPAGTRSLLQLKNLDTSPGPTDWTYYTVHHFFESSAGTWKLFIVDQEVGVTGAVQRVDLTISGVPITDTDHDGLDDNWEMSKFGTLKWDAKSDPDEDGYSNIREQLMGTDPAVAEIPFQLNLSSWNATRARLSWAGTTNRSYDIFAAPLPQGPFALVTNVPGQFPQTEWFTTELTRGPKFFRVQAR